MSAMHPDALALLRALKLAGRPRFETLSAPEARAAYNERRALIEPPAEEVASAENVSALGRAGPIALRCYRAAGTHDAAELPCLLYFHGGGWVLGDLDTHDTLCRRLANASGACIIAVDYRLAPEAPFPAAIDDGADALAFVVSHAEQLRIDPNNIVIGGDSAGGNIAAVLALMSRDGLLPKLIHQVLLYPVTDLTMAGGSYERVSKDVPISAATMRYFIDHYVPDPSQRTDWRASPLHAASLEGAPPAFVMTCAHDVLSDEGRAYAAKLDRAGVSVTELHLSDQIHGILTMGRAIGASAPILTFVGQVLQEIWRTAARAPVPASLIEPKTM